MVLSPEQGTSHRIRELDGWRAISVLLVVFSHFVSTRYLSFIMEHGFRHLGRTILISGSLGPKVFFVISGFVICRLLILEEQQYGYVSLKGFYYRRVFRILPPLLTYLAAVALLIATGMIVQRWHSLVYSALFLYDTGLAPTKMSWFVGHTWSLSVEEQFYLVLPTAWILTPARLRSRVAAGVYVLCIVLGLVSLRTTLGHLINAGMWFNFSAIVVGVWMAIHEQRVRQFAARVPGILIAAFCVFRLYHSYLNMPQEAAQYFYDIVTPLGVGVMLMYSLERGKWLRAVLCSKPMQAIGVTSYGIYLWQEIFTARVSDYTGKGMVLAYMLPLLLVIIPASYFFIEKPAIRMGRALSQRARKRDPAIVGHPIPADA